MSAAITLSQSKAPTGKTLTIGITGTGFANYGTVTVTIAGATCTFVNGGAVRGTGAFSDFVSTAPILAGAGVAAGAQTVSVTDGTNTATATLTTYNLDASSPKETQQSTSKTAYGTP